jgi:ubiquinone/menaquinone biosynthesis C-methylase UbiE
MNVIDQDTVKKYWEDKSPGLKHSDDEVGSISFFDKVEYERYSDEFKYKYLPSIANFNEYKNKKVLEVGVGLGTDILQFAKNGALAHGIDLTNKAIELTSLRFSQNGLSGVFKTATFTEIPFKDDSFDLIYSFGVLHHSEETQEGIDEIYRVAKPGGEITCMLYHKGFKYYIRKLFLYGVLKGEYLRHTSQEIINRHSEDYGLCPITKAYSRSDAAKMFSKFDNVTFNVYRLDDYIKHKGKFISLSKLILPSKVFRVIENKFGWNLIIKANKPTVQ